MAVTNLKYNNTEGAWQGSIKVFTNDLEDALTRLTKTKVDLLNPPDEGKLKLLLMEYLEKRFSIHHDNTRIPFTVLGSEIEEESLYIYIEAKCTEPHGPVSVFNTVLYDFLHEQIHIIEMESGGNKQNTKISYPASTATFKF